MITYLEIASTVVCATYIIVNARIFSWLRTQWSIFECAMCTGFWVGIICHWINSSVNLFEIQSVYRMLAFGAQMSIISFIFDLSLNKIVLLLDADE